MRSITLGDEPRGTDPFGNERIVGTTDAKPSFPIHDVLSEPPKGAHVAPPIPTAECKNISVASIGKTDSQLSLLAGRLRNASISARMAETSTIPRRESSRMRAKGASLR